MKHKIAAIFSVVVSIYFEYEALKQANIDFHDIEQLSYFFILHTLFSVTTAYAQLQFVPSFYKEQKKALFLLFGVLNFFVPVLGSLFCWLLIGWGFKKSQHIRIFTPTDDIDPHEISDGFPVVERIFGEGSLKALLENRYAPSHRKIKALSILTQMKTKSSLKLIKATLRDPDDEVRLVGFSMIDKLEKKINEKITELKNIILTQRDAKKRASYHKELAFTYWELLYQGVADEQLKIFVIDNLIKEIELAKEEINDDPSLYKLEARIYLIQKDYKKAKDAFVKALDLGIPKGEVASFMAEISFREKNYARIAYWMQKIPPKSINYQLLSLRAVWVKDES